MRNKLRSIVTVAATGFVLVACSESRSPLESGAQPVEQSTALVVPNPYRTDFIVFGDAALARTKSTLRWGSLHKQTEDGIVKASKKEKLKVKFEEYDAPLQVREATFEIAKNSIGGVDPIYKNYYSIGMSVETGQTLADIVVKFRPKGMTFDPVAILELKVKGELDPTSLVAYHISSNGKVTKPAFHIEGGKTSWKLAVEVPSFSEYSWDD